MLISLTLKFIEKAAEGLESIFHKVFNPAPDLAPAARNEAAPALSVPGMGPGGTGSTTTYRDSNSSN